MVTKQFNLAILKKGLLRLLGYLVGVAILVFYFAQSVRLPPNTVDGALILGYLEEISRGNLPFWGFVDVYGPLNWVFPYLFYRMADQEAWGVNVWMIVLKVVTIGVTIKLIKKLANGFYALLAACVTVILLGELWQLLNTPYASHTSYPLVVVVWYLALYAPFRRWRINVIIAGLLTAVVLWTKLNTGFFLLAGGLFYYFYWAPVPARFSSPIKPVQTGDSVRTRHFRFVQYFGLVAYGAVFFAYIWRHFNYMYFLYLCMPMLIGLGWTLREIQTRQRANQPVVHHIEMWLIFAVSTFLGWVTFFLAYYGPSGGLDYLSEQFKILTSITYEQPFLAPGAKSYYQAFSSFYWLQLPWLATALFCLWMALRHRKAKPQGDRDASRLADIQMGGLWLFFTMHSFVIYPRSDEAHMFQAIIATVPILFLILFHLEKLVVRRRLKLFRSTTALAVGLACSTLAIVPTFKVFADDPGDWYGARMRYLKYRPKKLEGVGNTSPNITDHNWDIVTNRTSICVDMLTKDGEEVLVLTSNQLVNYISKTIPFGEGYRYLFYLMINDLLDRETLESIIPERIRYRLLHQPPRVIVSAMGLQPMQRYYPELIPLLNEKYSIVQSYAHKLIYLPKSENAPKGICGQTPEVRNIRLQLRIIDRILGRNLFRD